MANDDKNRPAQQDQGQQNQGGPEGQQSGREPDKGSKIKPQGDYGVGAGRRYDDQTTRQVYEEPEGKSKSSDK